MNILLTDGGYKHTLAALRSLSKEGHAVSVVGGGLTQSQISRYCRNSYRPLNFSLFDSKLSLLDIAPLIQFIKSNAIELIIPISAHSVIFFAENKHFFAEHTNIILPEASAVSLCFDKQKSANYVSNLNIKIPNSYHFGSMAELEANIHQLNFPVVAKSSSELQTLPTSYYDNPRDLLLSMRNIQAILARNKVDFPLIQERIRGHGEGYFALYRDGQELAYFMHRRIRELPVSGGSSTCAESIFENDLLEAGRKILRSLKWNGVAMVEFKRNHYNGELYFMEVNPKFWGSLDLGIQAGIDFPNLLAKSINRKGLHEQLQNEIITYRTGVRYSWPLDGDLQHGIENPRAIFAVISDMVNPFVRSNLSILDPLPLVYGVMRFLKFIVRAILLKIGFLRVYSTCRRYGVGMGIYKIISEKTGIQLSNFCKITDNLYVGCQPTSRSFWQLKKWGVNTILDLRSEREFDVQPPLGFNYNHLPILEYQALSPSDIARGLDIIQKEVKAGNRVYLHCREGVGRAAMLALAFLCEMGMDYAHAQKYLKNRRPLINLNTEQERAMEMYFSPKRR